MILKPLQRALADGDRIYAVIRATAVNQDGRTPGISVPSQASQEANIADALRLADISPGTIQYVEAHGTGTPVGDPIEAAAIGGTYGKLGRSRGALRDRLDQEQFRPPRSGGRHGGTDQGGAGSAAPQHSWQSSFRESEPEHPVR